MSEENAATEVAPDEAKVFLSYSRKDRERAAGIADALRARRFGVFKDTDDILPTEEWKTRLEELIEEADTIVFLLSPHSAASEVCAWEVEYATALNKRIAPIVIDDVEGDAIPPLLARLNFIFCTPRDPFENAVDTLASALSTDIDWIREHTRLAGLARRWSEAGRPARLLLRGQDIADAEGWRDGRPAEAPAVTPDQAEFVAESRRAAGRRQRNWIMGSLAVAASAAALAVFAWFQSVEADRQRAEAETQRAAAEANAAEAERQRAAAEENADEAERQRREVARRLAAQSLRSAELAPAAETLLSLDPDGRTTKAALAGLATPEEASFRDAPGTPFVLNGLLYYSTEGAPVLAEGDPFPVSGWTRLGDDLVLVTDTARLRRVSRTGELVMDGPVLTQSTPCGVHRSAVGLTVVSHFARGFSACSVGIELTKVPRGGGAFEVEQPPRCERLDLAIGRGASIFRVDAMELTEKCSPFYSEDPTIGRAADRYEEIEAFNPLEVVRFPGAGPEATRWRGESDPMAIQRGQIERLGGAAGAVWSIADLAQMTEDGLVAPAFRLIDDMSTEEVFAFSVVSDWGGTGGEAHTVCFAPRAGGGTCVSFFTQGGGVRLALSPDGTRLAAYGRELSANDDRAGVWLMLPDGRFGPYPSVDGDVLSAAYARDGRLAVLTTSALTTFDADRNVMLQTRRPGEASAVAWADDDATLILFGEDGVAVGDQSAGFRLTPLTPPTDAKAVNGAERDLWLAQDREEGVLALGYGADVVVYDLALAAPLTRPFRVPHPRLQIGVSGGGIEALEDGGFRLTVAGETYERVGWDGGDPERRLKLISVYE